jgi:hypothetical protein
MEPEEQKRESGPVRPALAKGLIKALEYVELARAELEAVGDTRPTSGVQPYDLRRRLGIEAEEIKRAIRLVENEQSRDNSRPLYSLT